MAATPVTTLPLAVDTEDYRRLAELVREGRRPDRGTIRVDALIHAVAGFAAAPGAARSASTPPASTAPVELAATVLPTPWDASTRLLVVSLSVPDRGRGPLPVVSATISFNPALVRVYRRVGDGMHDAVALASAAARSGTPGPSRREAVELDPGHRITAVYEISLVDSVATAESYAVRATSSASPALAPAPGEIGTLEVSYRRSGRPAPERKQIRISSGPAPVDTRHSAEARLAVAAATIGERLAGLAAARAMSPRDVMSLTETAVAGARAADGRPFTEMVRRALDLGW